MKFAAQILRIPLVPFATLLLALVCLVPKIHAQSFGVEFHNTLMPASGAMGGVSIALPQDVTSAINGNPATLTQFQGTQFLDLPQNIGFGIANSSLMDGKLLLAADVVYKNWENAELFKAIYNDQWVLQLGSQYSLGNYRLRAGYVYAENPLNPSPVNNIGGVFPPGGPASVRYTQGLLAVSNQHRISFGMGAVDVLPGIDMDLMAGGMFRDSEQLGPSTNTSVASYWLGFGMSWRFGANPRQCG